MTPGAMANHIMSSLQGLTDAGQAMNAFYSALCQYVESNAEVLYSWSATTPPPTSAPDPMVMLRCTIKTSGTLTPSGATDPGAAMSMFSAALNQNAALWTVVWPSGFVLTPAFIIPSIVLTPSGATDMNSAWLSVAGQIIAGLKAATPTAVGTHGTFTIPTPGAIFTQIL